MDILKAMSLGAMSTGSSARSVQFDESVRRALAEPVPMQSDACLARSSRDERGKAHVPPLVAAASSFVATFGESPLGDWS